jgi:hypothetical protein
MTGRHKFNSGGYCEHCGQTSVSLNVLRGVEGKLPACPDAPLETAHTEDESNVYSRFANGLPFDSEKSFARLIEIVEKSAAIAEKNAAVTESNNAVLVEMKELIDKKTRTVRASEMTIKHYDSFNFGSFSIENALLDDLTRHAKFHPIKNILGSYTLSIFHDQETYKEEKYVQQQMRLFFPQIIWCFFDSVNSMSMEIEKDYRVSKFSEYIISGRMDEALVFDSTTVLFAVQDKNIKIDLSNTDSRKGFVAQAACEMVSATEQLLKGYGVVSKFMYTMLQNGREWILLKQTKLTDGTFRYQYCRPTIKLFGEESSAIDEKMLTLLTKWFLICLENVKDLLSMMDVEVDEITSKTKKLALPVSSEAFARDSHHDDHDGGEPGKGTSDENKDLSRRPGQRRGHTMRREKSERAKSSGNRTSETTSNRSAAMGILTTSALNQHNRIMSRTVAYYDAFFNSNSNGIDLFVNIDDDVALSE